MGRDGRDGISGSGLWESCAEIMAMLVVLRLDTFSFSVVCCLKAPGMACRSCPRTDECQGSVFALCQHFLMSLLSRKKPSVTSCIATMLFLIVDNTRRYGEMIGTLHQEALEKRLTRSKRRQRQMSFHRWSKTTRFGGLVIKMGQVRGGR